MRNPAAAIVRTTIAALGALFAGRTAAAAPGAVVAASSLHLESPDFTAAELAAAVEPWRTACDGGAALGSSLSGEEAGRLAVLVRRRTESTTQHGRCGQTTLRFVAGRPVAAVVDIFGRQRNGASCFPLTDEIAHEIGHVLGLDDRHADPSESIMGPRRPGTHRRVTREDCAGISRAPATLALAEAPPVEGEAPATLPAGEDDEVTGLGTFRPRAAHGAVREPR